MFAGNLLWRTGMTRQGSGGESDQSIAGQPAIADLGGHVGQLWILLARAYYCHADLRQLRQFVTRFMQYGRSQQRRVIT
jgi:hypothetical protein